MLVGITMAISQTDLKRMLAFSSVSQIGYVITAIGLATPLGITAGVYHMVNHAVFKSLLFLCAGAVYFRTHTTDLNKMGGLARKMPYTTALFIIGTLAIGGIPPFNGFVSKWLIYQATFEAGYVPVTIVALLCSVLSLATLLKAMQSVFFGQIPAELENVKEVPKSMLVPMGVLALIITAAGILPGYVDQYLIRPVTTAILNAGKYVDSIMGAGYYKGISGNTAAAPELTYKLAGYNPVGWLVVFGVVLIGFAIFILIFTGPGRRRKLEVMNQTAATSEASGKYDVFTGGEEIGYSAVRGMDLFWGLRHELRKYFGFIQGAHSGIVNDYSLWVVGTLAVVSLYLILVL
jgi:multicomponent Na+:H+ antiporter subunit D